MRPLAPRSPAAIAELVEREEAGSEASAEPVTLALAINGALGGRPAGAIPRRSSSARTSRPRAASTASRAGCTRGSAPAASSTRCSTRRRSSASPSGARSAASCRCRRSSTSRISTTRRISSAARRRRCSSSRRAATATAWSCGSRGTAIRRASAATSTTTTRSPCCATFPGVVIASPARPDDAAAMLRTCVAAAKVDGSVCAFLEPIALYHTRDLYEEGDGLWLAAPSSRARPAGLGAHLRRRPRPDHRHVGQRPPAVAPRRPPAARARDRVARRRPALARAAPDRGHRARGGRHAAGPRRRRDAADRAASRRESWRC